MQPVRVSRAVRRRVRRGHDTHGEFAIRNREVYGEKSALQAPRYFDGSERVKPLPFNLIEAEGGEIHEEGQKEPDIEETSDQVRPYQDGGRVTGSMP